MSAAMVGGLAWLLFGGSHLVLSSSGLRDRFAVGFGQYGFVIFYTVLSFFALLVLGFVQAAYGAAGAVGPGLARLPIASLVLTVVSTAGCLLMIFGFLHFGRSGMAQLSAASRSTGPPARSSLPPPTGIFRVSRHPFFVGLGLLMSAHAALATTLASSVFFAGFAILAVVGILLLDRKLKHRHGGIYEEYMASAPLIAVPKSVCKPRNFSVRVWRTILGVVAITLLAYLMHSSVWMPTNGGAFAFLMAMGGVGAVVGQVRRIIGKRGPPKSPD